MHFWVLLRAPYLFVSFCSAGFFVGPDFFRTKARDPHVPLALWKGKHSSTYRGSSLVTTHTLAGSRGPAHQLKKLHTSAAADTVKSSGCAPSSEQKEKERE